MMLLMVQEKNNQKQIKSSLAEESKHVRKLNILLHYVSEEGEAEEVISYVSCIKHKPATGTALLGSC